MKIILTATMSMLNNKNSGHQDRLAFLVLVRSSQIHFTPGRKLKGSHPREGEDKILRATTKTDDYNSLAAVVLRSPVLVSHRDTAHDCLGIHGAVDIFGWLQLAVWIILLSIASIDSGGQAHRASKEGHQGDFNSECGAWCVLLTDNQAPSTKINIYKRCVSILVNAGTAFLTLHFSRGVTYNHRFPFKQRSGMRGSRKLRCAQLQ